MRMKNKRIKKYVYQGNEFLQLSTLGLLATDLPSTSSSTTYTKCVTEIISLPLKGTFLVDSGHSARQILSLSCPRNKFQRVFKDSQKCVLKVRIANPISRKCIGLNFQVSSNPILQMKVKRSLFLIVSINGLAHN